MEKQTIQIDFLKDSDNEAAIALSHRCPQHGVISGYPDRSPVFNRIQKQIDPDSFHLVARHNNKIIGCIGAIYFPVQYGGRDFRAVYLLDFKVDEEYRKGLTAYRLVRETFDFLLAGGVELGFATIIKGNEASHIFTRGRAGFKGSSYLGDIRVTNIIPLWKKKTDPRFSIGQPTKDDIPVLTGLYKSFYGTYKLAPSITEELLIYYISNIEGMGLENWWVARESGKIRAVLCAWDENIYKRWQVIRIPLSIKMLFWFTRSLSPFMKVPAPVTENSPLKQKTLVMAAHNKCPGALASLIRHMNNIHLGKDYTVLQTHFHIDDEMIRAQSGLPGLKVDIELHAMSAGPGLAEEIASRPGPSYLEWPVFI